VLDHRPIFCRASSGREGTSGLERARDRADGVRAARIVAQAADRERIVLGQREAREDLAREPSERRPLAWRERPERSPERAVEALKEEFDDEEAPPEAEKAPG